MMQRSRRWLPLSFLLLLSVAGSSWSAESDNYKHSLMDAIAASKNLKANLVSLKQLSEEQKASLLELELTLMESEQSVTRLSKNLESSETLLLDLQQQLTKAQTSLTQASGLLTSLSRSLRTWRVLGSISAGVALAAVVALVVLWANEVIETRRTTNYSSHARPRFHWRLVSANVS